MTNIIPHEEIQSIASQHLSGNCDSMSQAWCMATGNVLNETTADPVVKVDFGPRMGL